MNGARAVMQRHLGLTIMCAAVATVLAGCATETWVKDYVAQTNAPIQASVRQVDARVTQVDARVTQVAGQASEARKVADEGVRKADTANGRVTKVISDHQKRTLVESTSLRFASGRFTLTPEQKKVLDEVYEKLLKNPSYTADVVGQADQEGKKGENYLLSLRRTEQVRRYLSGKGDVLHRISSIGFGEDMADLPKRQAEHRDVTVSLYKPDLQ